MYTFNRETIINKFFMTTQMLREIPLFTTLSPIELEDLLKQLEKETYPPNTVIFWMDEPGDKLYVIEKGTVRISYSNKRGKRNHIKKFE